MNDENKVPVPDEAQASPAHAEDDIATLEREARVKREAELLNAQDDEEKDPVQPAVNKLKKRKRGKATAFLAIVAVALIFLAWGGNWVYRNILWQPTEEKKQDTAPQTNKTDYRQRNDLGMSIDGSSLVVVAEGMIMVYLIARGHRHGRKVPLRSYSQPV
ncbi:hypothetical protein WDJ76_20240, partial [Escherichia coli]